MRETLCGKKIRGGQTESAWREKTQGKCYQSLGEGQELRRWVFSAGSRRGRETAWSKMSKKGEGDEVDEGASKWHGV